MKDIEHQQLTYPFWMRAGFGSSWWSCLWGCRALWRWASLPTAWSGRCGRRPRPACWCRRRRRRRPRGWRRRSCWARGPGRGWAPEKNNKHLVFLSETVSSFLRHPWRPSHSIIILVWIMYFRFKIGTRYVKLPEKCSQVKICQAHYDFSKRESPCFTEHTIL